MAYKPYKVNKGNKNNTKNYNQHYVDGTDSSKYGIVRLKLFGFRSGIAWKMIPALLYYIFAILFIVCSVIGEFREFTFESIDVVLCILKYFFISVISFGPAIFFSDFGYRDKLPLFKNRTVAGNIIGSLVVVVLSVFMIWTYQYCMSDTYKKSAEVYYAEQESIQQQMLEESQSQEEQTEEESVAEEGTAN